MVTRLKRKVKALSTTKFGSSESVNNRLGVTVPNTNVFAEGSNPIFQSNVNGESHFAPRGSDSSGDSVLVGVEDNPEFSGYKPKSNLSQGTWDLSKAVDDPVPRPSLMYATPVRNPLAGLVIDEEEEGVTNFGTDSEDERDPSHAGMFIHAGNEGRPPPVYPPPPPPDMTSQLKKRKAPPPPVDDYDNYAYGSDTEL